MRSGCRRAAQDGRAVGQRDLAAEVGHGHGDRRLAAEQRRLAAEKSRVGPKVPSPFPRAYRTRLA